MAREWGLWKLRVIFKTMLIEPLMEATEFLWERYVQHHPEGCHYQSLLWKKIFAETFQFKACHLIARDQKTIIGVLPLFKIPSFKGPLMSSIPFRDRAAPLYDNKFVLQKLLEEARNLALRENCRALMIKCPFEILTNKAQQGDFLVSRDWIRSTLVLPQKVDELWRQLTDKTRNMVRQGERSGLRFVPDIKGTTNVAKIIDLFRQTHHRLGIPPFPHKFYWRLHEELIREGSGFFSAVYSQDDIVSASVLLDDHKAFVYAYAGSSSDAWPLRANDFLIWNCLKLAIERGKPLFDFGSDSSHQDSVLFFKKKWGANQTPLTFYTSNLSQKGNQGFKWRDSSSGFYPFLRNIVKKLPRPLYNITGHFTHYFG